MKTLVKLVFVVMICFTILAQVARAAGTEYFVGLPPAIAEPDRQPVLKSILRLVTEADGGSSVRVFNAWTSEEIASIPIQNVPANARLKQSMHAIRAVKDFIMPVSPAGAAPNQLRVPAFLRTVRTSMSKAPGAGVRVVLVGSLFYSDSSDPSAVFEPGFVPSDGQINATSLDAVFGTKDLKGAFAGVHLDWFAPGGIANELETTAAERFWCLYAEALGSTICSFTRSADLAIDSALKGSTAACRSVTLDPTDTRVSIRRVERARHVDPAAPIAEEPVAYPVDTVLVLDGTGSMGPNLASARSMGLNVAQLGAKLTPRFTLGVVVYRDRDGFSSFGPERIDPVGLNGEESNGMVGFRNFLDVPAIDASVVDGGTGEVAGRRTGASRLVTNMAPLYAFADLEGGVRAGIEKLSRGTASRKILLIVGDVGTSESDHVVGVSSADTASASRTVSMIQELVKSAPDTRVITLYCGSASTPDRADTVALFKRMAEASGDRGVYCEDITLMEPIVKRAMLGD